MITRGDIALLHLSDEALGIAPVAGVDESMDRGDIEALTQHGEGMPLPLLVQKRIGQMLQMHPALGLWVPAPTGGDEMQMGVVLAIASMRVQHDNIAAFEPLAAELAIEIVQTLHPASHKSAQQNIGIVVEGGAQHGGDGENRVAIDDAAVEHLTDLADPVVHIHLGAS